MLDEFTFYSSCGIKETGNVWEVIAMNELLKKVEKAIEEQPYARFLGLKAEQAEEGKVVVSFAKKAELLQQTGTLHGGVIGGVCDAVAAYAVATVMPEGKTVLGVEYKANFLRPVTAEKVIAVGKVLKLGRQLVTAEVEVYNDGSDKLAAKTLFTGMLVDKT